MNYTYCQHLKYLFDTYYKAEFAISYLLIVPVLCILDFVNCYLLLHQDFLYSLTATYFALTVFLIITVFSFADRRTKLSIEQPTYTQPTYLELWQAYVVGAHDARLNPEATEKDFERAADAHCKLIHSQLDPVMFKQLGENND